MEANYTQTLTNFDFDLRSYTSPSGVPACTPDYVTDYTGAGIFFFNLPKFVGTWTTGSSNGGENLTIKNGALTGKLSFPSPNGIALGETVAFRAVRG